MIRFALADASTLVSDALIIPFFEEKGLEALVKTIDKNRHGLISQALETGDFAGKKMQMTLLYTQDKKLPRLVLCGLGSKKELDIRRFKQVVGAAVVSAQNKKCEKVAIMLPESVMSAFGSYRASLETVTTAILASYSFDEYRSKDARVMPITNVMLVGNFDARTKQNVQRGLDEGQAIGESINFTRHLGNIPPTTMTPTYLGREAEKLTKEFPTLKTKILSRPDMKKLGMGCLLGVSRGSSVEPKFIIMEYRGGSKKEKPIGLVGKGITYDSGGLSIKPLSYMNDMKFDMLGAATVIGTMRALAALKVKRNVVGLVPSCENMPDGEAYRPDDILVAMDGTTVHVSNTDAEGRLILADALCYAAKYDPKEVIDVATLTGHCRIALGMDRSGLFSDEEGMVKKLLTSSEEVGEQLWRLPLGEEFDEGIKSEVADIDNSGILNGDGRAGGASLAAAFLQHFVKYPWAHIDMSCCYYTPKGKPWIRYGANGFGVETLVEYIRN